MINKFILFQTFKQILIIDIIILVASIKLVQFLPTTAISSPIVQPSARLQ